MEDASRAKGLLIARAMGLESGKANFHSKGKKSDFEPLFGANEGDAGFAPKDNCRT
jgi:hypothetical protein